MESLERDLMATIGDGYDEVVRRIAANACEHVDTRDLTRKDAFDVQPDEATAAFLVRYGG